MQDPAWSSSHFAHDTLHLGLARAEALQWRLNVGQQAGQWVVVHGQATVFTSPSRDAVEAFLYGLSLAYVALPAAAFERLRAAMGAEADGLP